MNITFVGGGNMAASLIGGLIADGMDKERLSVVDLNAERIDYFKRQYGVKGSVELQDALAQADIVVLAVKPQAVQNVVQSMGDTLRQKPTLLLSIAAGIRCADLQRWSYAECAVVRAMPNTPALVQCGVSALYANEQVTPQQSSAAESILRATGITLWVKDESLMDAVTALSGSGPAYFFRIMESLIAAAQELGLDHEQAKLLTLQTALGAAKMALESDEDVVTLRERVTSPGGTTEEGLRIMNENNIDELMKRVLDAAQHRSVELSERLGAS